MIFKLVESFILNEADDDLNDIVSEVEDNSANPSSPNTDIDTNTTDSEDSLREIQNKLLDPKIKSNTKERDRLIDKAIEITFTGNAKNQVEPIIPKLKASIVRYGLNNNPIWDYAKNFVEKINNSSFKLDNSYIDFINEAEEQNLIKISDPDLYQSWMYNEDASENLYKIKTIVFLKNPNNVKNWGLYKIDENGKEVPIELKDIQSKTAQEIRVFLDQNQHGTGREDSITIGDILKQNNIKIDDFKKIIDFIKPLYSKEGKNKQDEIEGKLKTLFQDKSKIVNFRDLEIEGYEKGKEELIKPILDEFIKNDGEANLQSTATNINVPFKSTTKYFGTNYRMVVERIINLFKDANAAPAQLGVISNTLVNAVSDEVWRERLLNWDIEKFNDKDLASLIPSIAKFIQTTNEDGSPKDKSEKAALNRKRKSPPDTKEGILKKLASWMGSQEAMRMIPNVTERWDDIKATFEDNYEDGKTFEDMKRIISRQLS